jgi:hypothetical protein
MRGGLAWTLVLWVSVLLAVPRLAAAENLIERENAHAGARNWDRVVDSAGAAAGYASELSIVPGQRLQLHISTHERYRIRVYRLGWYGGRGARLMACEPRCRGAARDGRRFRRPPVEATSGRVVARWPVTDVIHTRRWWTSGEYLAEVILASGREIGLRQPIPFVVRAARPQPRSILVQVPVDTWEAYNDWGGTSLYDFNSVAHHAAVRVSFDRPWDYYGDSNTMFPLSYEYPLLRFLERSGFPLDYVTDVDVDRDPGLLLAHRLSVVLGHDEYWSSGIRAAWDAAALAGRNLAFLGANIGYWQIRFADRHRTIIEYRSRRADPDPIASRKTVPFRSLDPPKPECALEGVEFHGGGLYRPLRNSYTVAAATNPWLAAAGLRPGDVLRGAVKGEWDSVLPGCDTPAPTVLLRYAGRYPADATVMQTPALGRVFALGTDGFGSLVDDWEQRTCGVDSRAQLFLRAALIDLAQLRPAALPPPQTGCGPLWFR